MNTSLPRQILADAQFYLRLMHPDRKVTDFTSLAAALANKGWWLLAFHRVSHYSSFNRNLRRPLWWLSRLIEGAGRYICAVLLRSETVADCQINGPVYFSDKGYFIIGAKEIGGGTIVHHRVTIGMTVAKKRQERPVVGQNVWIGPDCVIAGGIRIGDGATILPGTYLTSNVAQSTVVRGNPARVICRNFDNSALRKSLQIITELSTNSSGSPQ